MFKCLSVLLLFGIAITEASIISEEIPNDCRERDEEVICNNVHLQKEDLESNTIVSERTVVIIKNRDIGIFGDKFLRKFPNCTKLLLIDVNVKLEPLHENWNINSLVFENCNITGIKDSKIFRSLPKLSLLGLVENDMDYKELDKSLLGENSEMKSIVIQHNDFESVSANAFDGLPNLEKIELSGFKDSFPPKLFENKPHLKSIKLTHNSLTKFPRDILPEGLTELSLKTNQISKLSADDFKSFKSAKTLENLYLGGNGIEELDDGVFDELENLKVLYLDYNKLKKVLKTMFENLKHLKRLALDGMDIKNSDVKDLGIQVDY